MHNGCHVIVDDLTDLHTGHGAAVRQRVLKKLGVTVPLEALYDYQGSSDLNLWTDLAAKHHLSQRPEALVKAKAYLFNRLMHEQGVTPIKGVLSLIKRTDALRAEGLRTAIASSSALDFIEFVTASLGIRDCFDALQSAGATWSTAAVLR